MRNSSPLASDRPSTVAEIAAYYGVCEKTVRSWIRCGDLVAHRLGRQYRITPADRDAFMGARRVVK